MRSSSRLTLAATVALFCLPEAAAAVLGSSALPSTTVAATAAPVAKPDTSSARSFSRAVLADVRRGAVLRDLRVQDSAHAFRLRVTLARGDKGREHTLSFSPHGDRVIGYSSQTVRVRDRGRIYPIEAEFLQLLALAPPDRIMSECGDYYLESGDAGVTIDPDFYYKVEERVVGARAASALRRALVASLANGMQLGEVTVPAGESQVVELALEGDTRRTLRVELGAGGAITAVEVRVGPPRMLWQVYTRTDELRRALRGGLRHLRAIEIGERGPEADTADLVLVGARRFAIEMTAFEPGDLECGC